VGLSINGRPCWGEVGLDLRAETPATFYAELGTESRFHMQRLWTVVQFFASVITSLLALGMTVVGLGNTVLPVESRYLVGFCLGLLAVVFGAAGLYAWATESYYWERARLVYRLYRSAVLRRAANGNEVAPASFGTFSEMLDLGIDHPKGEVVQKLTRFHSRERDHRLRDDFLRGLGERALPSSGLRFVMYVTLWILSLAGVALTASSLDLSIVSETLLPGSWTIVLGATATGCTVALLVWVLRRTASRVREAQKIVRGIVAGCRQVQKASPDPPTVAAPPDA
jgi:hypothetical protein